MNPVLQKWMDDFCAKHGGKWWVEPKATPECTGKVIIDGKQSNRIIYSVGWQVNVAKTKAGGDISTRTFWPICEDDLRSAFMLNGLSTNLLRKQSELLPHVREIASRDDAIAVQGEINRRRDG